MCAIVDLKAQSDFIKKNKNNHKIKLFKLLKTTAFDVWNPNVYNFESIKQVTGPYRKNYIYHPGINKSDSRQKLQNKNQKSIDKGIHCFTSKRAAKNYDDWCEYTLVTIYADIDDLICIGEDKQAVFKKIYLSKESYNRVLRK